MNKQLKGLAQKERLVQFWAERQARRAVKGSPTQAGVTEAEQARKAQAEAMRDMQGWADRDVMWDTTYGWHGTRRLSGGVAGRRRN